MFQKSTVFILGAGASWHYGYPTGEELVRRVIAKADEFSKFCNSVLHAGVVNFLAKRPAFIEKVVGTERGNAQFVAQWSLAKGQAEQLSKRLRQVNPPVIDYFLGQNPALQNVGKLMIAWVLLEREARYVQGDGLNPNRERTKRDELTETRTEQDDWCRFILYELVSGCRESADILKNAVTFITFNYDISFETQIANGLKHIELFRDDDVQGFFKRCPVHHVYGSLRKTSGYECIDLDVSTKVAGWPRDFGQQSDHLDKVCGLLDAAHSAGEGLRTIGPKHELGNSPTIAAATRAIRDAQIIYVLGYGFDDNNSEILDLAEGLRGSSKHPKFVFCTNFHDTGRVNRRMLRLISRGTSVLTHDATKVATKRMICEKSVRDVYGALSVDFDVSEGEAGWAAD